MCELYLDKGLSDKSKNQQILLYYLEITYWFIYDAARQSFT